MKKVLKKRWVKGVLAVVIIVAMLPTLANWYVETNDSREPSRVSWNKNCASCHGVQLQGTPQGTKLVDTPLKYSETADELIKSITRPTHTSFGTPWGDKLSATEIKGLALFISERRQKFPTTPASYKKAPEENREIKSVHHDFYLERIATLASRPYSIDIMFDSDILVAEKTRGLTIVNRRTGQQSEPLVGTPEVSDTLLSVGGAWMNLGSILDVEMHPDYDNNGWVYLSYTDRCQFSCGWPVPATMVRVVRGRILNGKWVDQELVWSVHHDHYTPVPDGVAAGRLAFDGKGYLYISIGGKNSYDKLHDMNTPFGKIHRVYDDGSIPEDNPFWLPEKDRDEASTRHTVWSFGHRTGQGLDAHPETGEIWNTEMGPRGGDEVNIIIGGKNYGWPLYTNGLDYNGEEITIGKDLGLDYPLEDTQLPVVDFTPAPAVSNFTFHNGDKFPKWKNDLLVGSLKASTLYRLRIEDGKLIEQEKLITDFGRIRDVEMGRDGFVYVIIEHNEEGSLWRLVPK